MARPSAPLRQIFCERWNSQGVDQVARETGEGKKGRKRQETRVNVNENLTTPKMHAMHTRKKKKKKEGTNNTTSTITILLFLQV